jgi:hypothetical protein
VIFRIVTAVGAIALATSGVASAGPALRPAAVIEANKVVDWNANVDGNPAVYRIGALTITLGSRLEAPLPNTVGQDEVADPVVTVRAGGKIVARVRGAGYEDVAHADFAVSHIDPGADGPAVITSSYTGGAHCCYDIKFVEQVKGRWRTIDAGSWDGEFDLLPADVDGDGVRDYVQKDGSFDYAFTSYAGSDGPPRIFDVINGQWRDVSNSERFRKLFEAKMASKEEACREHDNGACATFVASAARIGKLTWAWQVMLSSYDKNWLNGYAYDIGNGGRPFKNLPSALLPFLVRTGYISSSAARTLPIE